MQYIVEDRGQLHEKYPNMWAGLADKGYEGADDYMRLITPPVKESPLITPPDNIFNKKISLYRVIIDITMEE